MRVPAIRLSVGDPGARRGQSTHSTATFNFDGAVLAPASTSALEVAYPLLPAPSGAPSDAVELRVGEMVMYGEVWDVFAATLNLPPGPSDSPTGDGLAVVVKLCALSDYAPVPRIARDGGTTRAHVETCIATELDIYVHELSSLAVVPELYGAFVGSVSDGGEEVRVWAVVLEDVGLSMVPEDLDTCPELETQLEAAYAALHAAGVLHYDVTPRHWLVRGGRVRLVDFDHTFLRRRIEGGPEMSTGGEFEGKSWEMLCQLEVQEMRDKLPGREAGG